MKHLLKLWDLTGQEIIDILNLADQLKYEQKTALPTIISRARPWG